MDRCFIRATSRLLAAVRPKVVDREGQSDTLLIKSWANAMLTDLCVDHGGVYFFI